MGPTGPDWVLPGVVLGVAVLLGTALVWRVYAAGRRAASTVAPAEPLERRDLAGKRDALLRQLRELEDTSGKRLPDQLARERYALELEAARAWMALDALPAGAPTGHASPTHPAVPSAAAAPAPPSAIRGFLWGVGTMVVLGAMLFWVAQVAQPRQEGGSLTGNLPTEEARGAPVDAEEAELRAALEQHPEDLDTRLDLARLYLGRQEMMAVWNETQFVLQRSPDHPRALAYQALVRLAMGQPDLAESMLQKALGAAPDLLEGYLHLALVHTRMGRAEQADKVLADAMRRFPDQKEGLERVAREMRTLAAEGPAELEGDPHAGVAPPSSAAPKSTESAPPAQQATATGGGGRRLEVELDLDPDLRGSLAPGTVLFVIVREAGMQKGPPAAVKRMVPSGFPLKLVLSEADSMAGEPIPAEVRLEARLDSDGDPISRSPADPSATLDDVRVGAGPVRLQLRRQP